MIFWTLEDDVESYLFPLFCDFVVFFLLGLKRMGLRIVIFFHRLCELLVLGWILMIFWNLEDNVESYLFSLFCVWFRCFFLLLGLKIVDRDIFSSDELLVLGWILMIFWTLKSILCLFFFAWFSFFFFFFFCVIFFFFFFFFIRFEKSWSKDCDIFSSMVNYLDGFWWFSGRLRTMLSLLFPLFWVWFRCFFFY